MASRRDVLKLGALSLLAAAVLSRSRVARAEPARRGPRYFVSIFLSGGIDAIYTTAPKRRAEVDAMVDVPYPASAIVEAGNLRLGPHLAPFAPLARRMAILNGVAVHTANHNTGTEQFVRMRTRTRPEMPPIFQLIGEKRDSQATSTIGWAFGAPQLQRVFDESPEDLARMAELLLNQEKGVLSHHGDLRARATANNLHEASTLLSRASKCKPLAIETWSQEEDLQQVARSLQRILWVLENDLSRAHELNIGGTDQPWDTHTFNTERQTNEAKKLPLVARFFAELAKRPSPRGGVLADETLVILGSEIGRFPALNKQQGKDHFPEVPFVFFGAGIKTNVVIGRTGRSMQAIGDPVRLDDVGATLMKLGGFDDPSVCGYDGRVLEALIAS